MKNFAKIYPDLSHSAGFTLVEMLVVISVISLLMAIIVPVLGRAKAAAYQVVCQSRLRQWGIAFEGYATQNRGFYPHIDGTDRNSDEADLFGWVDMLPPLFGEKRWRDYKWWNKPGKNTIFQCPLAEPAGGDYNYNPAKIGYFSYAMNSCLELDKGCWAPYGQTNWSGMPSFLNTVSIKMPSRVILLFEQLLETKKGYNNTGNYRAAGRYCGSYPISFSAQHPRQHGRLGGDILYCDYHIEWTASVWKPEWPVTDPNFQAPPRNDLDWYPY